MNAIELVQLLSNALFVLVFLSVLARAVRAPRRANVDAAIFFGALALIVVQSLITRTFGIAVPAAVGLATIAILLALPILTLRLVNDLLPVAPLVMRSCFVGWLLTTTAFLVLPRELLVFVTLPLVVYFFGYEAYAGFLVLRATRPMTGVVRRRLYAVGAGSLLLAGALLVAGLGAVVPQLAVLTNVVGLASAVAYYVGFSTPTFLRRAWQEPELRGFMTRAAHLAGADSDELVRGIVAGAARVTGADQPAVELWDEARGTLRFHLESGEVVEAPPAETASGTAFIEQRSIVRFEGDGGPPLTKRLRDLGMRSVLATPITSGRIRYGVLAAHAKSTPLFAEDDLELLEILAGQIALLLKNHDLFTEVRSLNAELGNRVRELDAANEELSSFAYAVSHDLRAPLRAIDGFSEVLLDEKSAALGEEGREHLGRVRRAAQNMGHLIDDLLSLSRTTRAELRRQPVDLSALARGVAAEHAARAPERRVSFRVEDGLEVEADDRLLRVALDNLIGNAWKFTRTVKDPTVELGSAAHNGTRAYYVRDNGIGFEMQYKDKLFTPFQRLHSPRDFEGSGIGLATVRRVIRRHGGEVWAESAPGKGATFYFTLPADQKLE